MTGTGLVSLTDTAVITTSSSPTLGCFNRYNATAGALTPNLPALAGEFVGARMSVEKYAGDVTGHSITFTCAGSDTFDDTTTQLVIATSGQQRELQVVAVGSTKFWKVVGSIAQASFQSTDIGDASATGRGVLTAPTKATARAAISAADKRKALMRSWDLRPTQRMVYPAADAPVVTLVDNPSVSQVTGQTILVGATGNYIDVIGNQQVSLFGACNPQHVGSYPGTITYKNECKQLDVVGTHQIYAYTLQFYSDSDKVELIWANTAAGHYRVWVDDQAVGGLAPVATTLTGHIQSLTVDFSGAVIPAKTRRYRIELMSADFIGMFVNSTSTPPKYSIWKAEQRGPTAFFMGDSFLGGSGIAGTSYIQEIPQYVGSLLGWDNVWNLAQGGTGWLAKNAPSSFDNSALPQISFLAPSTSTPSTTAPGSSLPTPDVLYMAFGHNDAVPWSSGVQAAALASVTQARAQWPDVFMILGGPFFSGLGTTTYNSSETAFLAATAAIADAQISSLQGPNRPWLTGSGFVGGTTGSGNGDVYIGSDSVHPTAEGIAYLSERLYAELRTAMSGA